MAVVNGVSFYIGTLPKSACDYSYLVIDTSSPSASAEHNIGFGENGVGQGYSITNNPGNTGVCTTGRLDPLSFSQGQWDMPPGQFSGVHLVKGKDLQLRRALDMVNVTRPPRQPS